LGLHQEPRGYAVSSFWKDRRCTAQRALP